MNPKQTKLSKLQRWVIARAWANVCAEQRDGSSGADFFPKEAMADYYGLPLWLRDDTAPAFCATPAAGAVSKMVAR